MKKLLHTTEHRLLIFCIVLGVVQAWIGRYSRIPDGIAYLDIGDAYFRGDWAAAINGYWSPMYSWFLGLALYLFKPGIWRELIIVHLVNLIIYLIALYSFRFFIHSILRAINQNSSTPPADSFPLPEPAFLALAYSIFLWGSLVLIDVGEVTPDLLVAALVFLIAGYLVELRAHQSYRKFALFGGLNGLAYLTKGVMFPTAFVFLTILFFSGRRSRQRLLGVLMSAIVFLAVCSPFILALSKAKGRLTYGDTGKLAYASMVSPGTPQRNWQGEPPGSGTPLHPTRELLHDPPVFEFAEPIKGTYPSWDDPSYWNEGLRLSFHFRAQLRVLVQSAFVYGKYLLGELGLLAGLLIFLFMGGKPTQRAIASNWPLLAAALFGLITYALVLVLSRYIGASLVLLWVALIAGIRLPKNAGLEPISKYVAFAVAVTVLLTVAAHMTDTVYANLTVGAEPSARDEMKTAEGLLSMGMQAGDEFAVIGRGVTNHWARLARFRIIAEAAPRPEALEKFWTSPPERRNLVYECLSRTGARAVIAWDPPPSTKDDPRWKRIAGTNYYAYFFPK